MKFLELTACSALLLFGALRVDAAELRLEALSLNYASPWQRGTPQLEAEDDALLLDAADAGLQLIVPRRTRLLKIEADAYYVKLSQNWQKLYGSEAKISWFEPSYPNSIQKWLLCRRPMGDKAGSVFHLSTVVDGRAYSVLLFAPVEAGTLPKLALDLLASVRVGNEPTQAAAQPAWIKTRTLIPKANAEVLEAQVQSDVARLGDEGMVTGYGLDFGASSVDWFMDGYQWKTVDARDTQVDWNLGGRLEARIGESAQPVHAMVHAELQLALKEGEADISAHLSVWDLCATSPRVTEVLAQVQRGAFAQIPRLVQERASGCPATFTPAAPVVLRGVSGKTTHLDVALTLPPAPGPAELSALRQAGLTRIALIEIALSPGPARTGFGDRLIERARWYVVLEMGEAGFQP